MTEEKRILLSRIEADELHEAKRGIGGYSPDEAPQFYIDAYKLLAEKGLVTLTISAWDGSSVDAEITDSGLEEYHRYHTLPRLEDDLIQSINFLEAVKAKIILVVEDLPMQVVTPNITQSLIALAKALRTKDEQS